MLSSWGPVSGEDDRGGVIMPAGLLLLVSVSTPAYSTSSVAVVLLGESWMTSNRMAWSDCCRGVCHHGRLLSPCRSYSSRILENHSSVAALLVETPRAGPAIMYNGRAERWHMVV